MKFLFIIAHKAENKFVVDLATKLSKQLKSEKHETKIVDLYKIKFNPVGGDWDFKKRKDTENFDYPIEQKNAKNTDTFADDIKEQQKIVKWADNIFFFFPLTHYSMPCIVKGYFDRIFSYHFAHGGVNTLSPRKAMLIVYNPSKVESERIENYFKDIYQTLGLCGLRMQHNFYFEEKGEKVIEHLVKHVGKAYSFKNRFVQQFHFPRLKSLGAFSLGKFLKS